MSYTIETQCVNIQWGKYSETDTSEYDYRVYQRSFSGRMTKKRWKKIDAYCRRNSFSSRCGCEHDCCGHLCRQHFSFTYSLNQLVINVTRSFNY